MILELVAVSALVVAAKARELLGIEEFLQNRNRSSVVCSLPCRVGDVGHGHCSCHPVRHSGSVRVGLSGSCRRRRLVQLVS